MTYATATLADLQRLERLLTLEELADEADTDDTEAYVDRLTEDEVPMVDRTTAHLHSAYGDLHLCTAQH